MITQADFILIHFTVLRSRHKQLDGDLKGINFVILAVQEQEALMRSS